jgi:hypothetical protein
LFLAKVAIGNRADLNRPVQKATEQSLRDAHRTVVGWRAKNGTRGTHGELVVPEQKGTVPGWQE